MSNFPSQTIRAARPEDAPGIRALVRSAYAKWVPSIGREPLPMIADYDRAIRDHEIALLHAGVELIALVETYRKSDHLFLENLAVAPAHQGRGIGRRLLAHIERGASAAGLEEIRLLTNSAFESNVRLYQAIGYRVDRLEPFMGGGVVHMSKKLATP